MESMTMHKGAKETIPGRAGVSDVFLTTDSNEIFQGAGPTKALTQYGNVCVYTNKYELPLPGVDKTLYFVKKGNDIEIYIWDGEKYLPHDYNSCVMLHNLTEDKVLTLEHAFKTIIVRAMHQLTLTLPIAAPNTTMFAITNLAPVAIQLKSSSMFSYKFSKTNVASTHISIRPQGTVSIVFYDTKWIVNKGVESIDTDVSRMYSGMALDYIRPVYF